MISTGRDQFLRYRRLIAMLQFAVSWLPKPLVRALEHIPGTAGTVGRFLSASRSFASIGEACYLAPKCVLKNVSRLAVGDRFSLHEFCYIDAAGGVTIGNDVAIAHGCSILSTNHTWSEKGLPIKYSPVQTASVEIGDDVWIGCGVRVLAGTRIKQRVVIAAGAVVSGELESGYLYGGVPARKLKPL